MKNAIRWALSVLLLVSVSPVYATEFSTADYDLYPGDFNGDGKTDLLYIAKTPDKPSGIALADANGVPQIGFQTWSSTYLAIPWSNGSYKAIIGDFNGDGYDDILLQPQTPGNTYVLLANTDPNYGPSGQILFISQAIPQTLHGVTWSADTHHIIAGDFDGDHHTDLFFQATSATGMNAIVLADASGNLFTRSSTNCIWNGQVIQDGPQQCWGDGYQGFKWSTYAAVISSGDFNGDHKADLLMQARPTMVMIDYDVPFPVPRFGAQAFGIFLAQTADSSGAIIRSPVQTWNSNDLGGNWSPLVSNVVIGDFNGSGLSGVLLQSRSSGQANVVLYASSSGTGQLQSATALPGNAAGWTADNYHLIVGKFGGSAKSVLFLESTTLAGTDYYSSDISAASVTATAATFQVVSAQPSATTAVGVTVGASSVSGGGAFTHTIPIWVPPGTRGIEPHIELDYNSRNPDGVLGPGWSLGGLSAIARCNRTYAQDGTPAAVTITSADALCVDGNRLRLTGTIAYWQDGSTYQTEVADFSNVILHVPGGNISASWFEVQRKDGLTYEYGNDPAGTNLSRVALPGTTTPVTWGLNKIRDRQQNNLIVNYSQANGTFVPLNIQYTQVPSTGEGYDHTVSFTYGPRSPDDNIIGYVNGRKVVQTNQLNEIDVISSGTTVRKYTLTYTAAPATARARLAVIQECADSAGTVCLAPTGIGYQDGAAGVAAFTPTGPNPSGFVYGSAECDLNGDGRTDLVFGIFMNPGYHWYVQVATATGFEPTRDTGITSDEIQALCDDFVGEGRDSLLLAQGASWTLYRYTGTQYVSTPNVYPVDAYDHTHTAPFATADVNGDGLPDLVSIAPDTSVHIRMNTSAGGNLSFAPNSLKTSAVATVIYGNSGSGRHIDFDGDGRNDLIAELLDTHLVLHTSILASRNTDFAITPLPELNSGAVPVNWNNDACTDFWQFHSIYISGCNGGTAGTVPLNLGNVHGPSITLDWDGDGRTDILIAPVGGGEVQLYRSTGDRYAGPTPTGIILAQNEQLGRGDFDGDGLDDLLIAGPTDGQRYRYALHASAGHPADLLTSVKDGFDVKVSPAYVPIVQGSYTKGTGTPPPVGQKDYVGPVNVVAQVEASDGVGGVYRKTYSYTGARLDLQGRGFLGFFSRSETDSRNGLKSTEFFQQTFPQTGLVSHSVIYQPDQVTVIRDVLNTVLTNTLDPSANNQRFFPYVQQSVDSQYEVNGPLNGQLISQTTEVHVYDNYGNTTNLAVSVTDKDPTSPNVGKTWQTTTALTIAPQTAQWCLNLPTQITVTRTTPIPTPGSVTRTSGFMPDYTNCRTTQEVDEPGGGILMTTKNIGHDGCGNVNSIQVLGTNPDGSAMTGRTTQYNYAATTARCTFPETVTNALNETSTLSYNYDYGVRSSVQDPNGLSTSWGYDSFARLASESRPDGTQTVWTRGVCSPPTACGDSDLRYYVQQNENDGTASHATYWYRASWFDQLGRIKYDEPLQSNGRVAETQYNYDALGRLTSRSFPWVNGNDMYWADFTYDVLDRLTAESRPINSINPSIQSTGYAYAGRTLTVTDPKLYVTRKQADPIGELLVLTDPDGVTRTSYSYEPFGNLASVTAPGGSQMTRGYDKRGHLLNSADPDRGSWTFQVDSLGDLINVRDANTSAPAWTTQYTYDGLGRPATRLDVREAAQSVWRWGQLSDNTATNKYVGRLKQFSGLGDIESYVFDQLGRMAGQSMTWSGTTYSIDYAYNTLGKIDTLTYPTTSASPNRFAVKYGYTGGYLSSLANFTGGTPGTVFWQLTPGVTNMDPWGHVVNETLGTGTSVRIQSAYDPVTALLGSRQVGSGGTAGNLQSLSYQWDLNGNLSQRQDLSQNLTEAFNYDNLNRLQSSTLNTQQNLNVIIDPAGNITSRTENGSTFNYAYDPTHLHAVKTVTQGSAVTNYTYDADGNMQTWKGNTVRWASYNLPTSIIGSGVSSTFSYGPDRQRKQQVATYPGGTETTIYVAGLFEVETTSAPARTHYKHYVGVPGGTKVIYDLLSTGGSQTSYITGDHLGSANVLLDATGTPQLNESFSAYGYRRGSKWAGPLGSPDATEIAATTRRGYTFHEMLDNLGLIHMNGRVYDPTIGRFLSPDPVVSHLGNSQDLNPYSYAGNRPLSAVDPSGYDDVIINSPPEPDPNDLRSELRQLFKSEFQQYSGNGHSMPKGMIPGPVQPVLAPVSTCGPTEPEAQSVSGDETLAKIVVTAKKTSESGFEDAAKAADNLQLVRESVEAGVNAVTAYGPRRTVVPGLVAGKVLKSAIPYVKGVYIVAETAKAADQLVNGDPTGAVKTGAEVSMTLAGAAAGAETGALVASPFPPAEVVVVPIFSAAGAIGATHPALMEPINRGIDRAGVGVANWTLENVRVPQPVQISDIPWPR